jgi:hypothetical protein
MSAQTRAQTPFFGRLKASTGRGLAMALALTWSLLLGLALSACGGGGGGGDDSPSPGATPSGNGAGTGTTVVVPDSLPALPADAYVQAPSPTTVSSSTDDSRAATATIGSAGGTLMATAADGSKFMLVVPPNALSADTDITMTPIASTTGAPWSQASGVRLEPEGLQFLQFATLTIEPASAVPVAQQVVAGALKGSELFLALPDVGSALSRIHLLHFTDYWLTNMSPEQLTAQRLHIPSSAQVQIENEIGAILNRERQRQLLGASGNTVDIAALMAAVLPQWFEHVLKPRINRGNSCAQWKDVLAAMLGIERQRQLLGMEDGHALGDVLNGTAGDLWGLAGSGSYIAANVPFAGSLAKVTQFRCAQEATSRCETQHLLGLVELYLGDERQRQLLGMPADGVFDGTYMQWEARLQACYRFSVQLHSDIKLINTPGADTIDTAVSATLDDQPFKDGLDAALSQQLSGMEALAQSTLSNTALSVSSPLSCGTVSNVTKGDGLVSGLFRIGKVNASGRLDSASVKLYLGDTAEAWSLSGCGTGALRFGPRAAWTDGFLRIHDDQHFELPGISRGVVIKLGLADLRVNRGEVMVNKSWQRTVGDVSEDSNIKVIHTPVPLVEAPLP